MAIPVPPIPSPLAGMLVPVFAYRACPDGCADCLIRTVPSAAGFLTLRLWSLPLRPFLAWTFDNSVIRFCPRGFSSSYPICHV